MAFVVNQAASWPFADAIFRLEDCIDTDSKDETRAMASDFAGCDMVP